MRSSEGVVVLFPRFSCDLQRISVSQPNSYGRMTLKAGFFLGILAQISVKKSFLASVAFVLVFISLFHSVTPQGIILLALPRCSRRYRSSSRILHPHAVS